MNNEYVTIDNQKVPLEGERNILELARKAHIEIPTFCYHSELSVYGACRLCLVEIEGRGIVASCAAPAKPGMVIKTNTEKIRRMRRMNLELILANHKRECTTCKRSDDCQLRKLAVRMGLKEIRFDQTKEYRPLDTEGPSLIRDPNKCVLCGDCVRYCAEIQKVGAIDFANRGEDVIVTPAFGGSLESSKCVNCGQCSAVCPTGAIVPKSHADAVWKEINDPETMVVAQIAPAVRVALGEAFGMTDGRSTSGRIVKALRILGFDKVFDSSFGADLTVIEESNELLSRLEKGKKGPLFTSCCPGWISFVDNFFPELKENISTCMSPQSMTSSLVKDHFKSEKRVVSVSIMPCTAKKAEIKRPELSRDGEQLTDYCLTTQELIRMIKESGIRFRDLPVDSIDLPFGFNTGSGLIFGNSGGVTEAVVRYLTNYDSAVETIPFEQKEGYKAARIPYNGTELNIAVVQGLGNARTLIEELQSGKADFDFVEVMACPGGCIGGAGQPVKDRLIQKEIRAKGLSDADKRSQLHVADQNPFLKQLYEDKLGGKPGSKDAHRLLHT